MPVTKRKKENLTTGPGVKERLLVPEIFHLISQATTDEERETVIQNYRTPALLHLIQAMYDPRIDWNVQIPENWKPNAQPEGLTETTLLGECRRLYIFTKNSPATPKVKTRVLRDILEGCHYSEAILLTKIVTKQAKIPGVEYSFLKKTFGKQMFV